MGTLKKAWPFGHTEPEPELINTNPPTRLGLNSHMLRPEDLADLKVLGMRLVRVPGVLQKWEQDTDNYRAVVEDMNRAATQNNLKLLWYLHNVVDGEPQYADSLWHGEQWAARMTEFCGYIAGLDATEAIQPWNEVNGYRQQPFGLANNYSYQEIGNLYGLALRLHTERIHQVAPWVEVVSAGLTLLPGWHMVLRSIVGMGTGVDAYAIHPYGHWTQAKEALAIARSITGVIPVWATEFGNDQQNHEPVDLEKHYQAWRSFIEGNAEQGLAERAYAYVLQTDPRYPQHGLLNEDGTFRKAGQWLMHAEVPR